MKAFMSGLAGTIVIGLGAWFVLSQQLDYSSVTVNTSHKNNSVRLTPGMGERGGYE